jgi:hypothetical protein
MKPSKRVNELLENGFSEQELLPGKPFQSELFALIGDSKSVDASRRGRRIVESLEKLGRSPPRFAAIAQHSATPRHLPDSLKNLESFHGYQVRTFDFLPLPEHADYFADRDPWKQTLRGSIAHLALLINPQKREALVAQVQGNARPVIGDEFGGGEPVKLEGKPLKEFKENLLPYSNSHLSLVFAAKHYCNENGLTFHFPSPHFVKGLNNVVHRYSSADPYENIGRIYNSTRRNLAKLFESERARYFFPSRIPLRLKYLLEKEGETTVFGKSNKEV